MKLIISFFSGIVICISAIAQSALDIIPKPVLVKEQTGKPFMLNDNTILHFQKQYSKAAIYFKQELLRQTGVKNFKSFAREDDNFKENGIYIALNTNMQQHPEMYQLIVSEKNLIINAYDDRGAINAIQSLLQLIPIKKTNQIYIKPVFIEDYPRFLYRGMHLDVVRHIFPVSYIKKYIDYLTFHKFNTFHWHLTDDQGWRIEMNQYKKLNTIGSWRNETLIGHFKDTPARYDATRYGGYYTKA